MSAPHPAGGEDLYGILNGTLNSGGVRTLKTFFLYAVEIQYGCVS